MTTNLDDAWLRELRATGVPHLHATFSAALATAPTADDARRALLASATVAAALDHDLQGLPSGVTSWLAAAGKAIAPADALLAARALESVRARLPVPPQRLDELIARLRTAGATSA